MPSHNFATRSNIKLKEMIKYKTNKYESFNNQYTPFLLLITPMVFKIILISKPNDKFLR